MRGDLTAVKAAFDRIAAGHPTEIAKDNSSRLSKKKRRPNPRRDGQHQQWR